MANSWARKSNGQFMDPTKHCQHMFILFRFWKNAHDENEFTHLQLLTRRTNFSFTIFRYVSRTVGCVPFFGCAGHQHGGAWDHKASRNTKPQPICIKRTKLHEMHSKQCGLAFRGHFPPISQSSPRIPSSHKSRTPQWQPPLSGNPETRN